MKKLTFIAIIAILLSFNAFAQECDYKVEIIASGDEFESQDFKWRMRAAKIEGKPTNITGTAEIEDSNGKSIKTYKPWTLDSISKQKTSSEYSPNLKPGSYEITAEISVDCDDSNKGNNVDKKKIKIKGEEEAKDKKSEKEEEKSQLKNSQKITKAADNAEIQAETAPEPIQNQEAENVVQLKNKDSQKSQEPKLITANLVESQKQENVYESSSEKAKGWIMALLLTLSILLNIILIWKR